MFCVTNSTASGRADLWGRGRLPDVTGDVTWLTGDVTGRLTRPRSGRRPAAGAEGGSWSRARGRVGDGRARVIPPGDLVLVRVPAG